MRLFLVNVIPSGNTLVIPCNQFEKGDTWAFQLYYDGERYDIPSGATVKIIGTKKDGAAYAIGGTLTNNEAVFTVTEQMTAVGGRSVAELLIISGNVVTYSANFLIMVEPSALQGDLIDSELPDCIVTADGDVYMRIDIQLDTALTATDRPAQGAAVGNAIATVRGLLNSAVASINNEIADAVHSADVSYIQKVSRAEYDAITVKDENTLYMVVEE